MKPNLNQRISTFSKGMRQKVMICSALLHNPDLIFMDEPLSGLDANSVIMVKEMLVHLAREGKNRFLQFTHHGCCGENFGSDYSNRSGKSNC